MPVSRRRRGRSANRSARSGNLSTTIRRKKTNKFYIAASVVIAVLVIASFAFASFSGGGRGGSTSGVGERVPILDANHIPEGSKAVYNSVPPTSGEHWSGSNAPRSCGFYEEQLPDEQIVHNLEHGNIVVSYNLPLEADVSALRDALNSIGLDRQWGVTRFYDKINPGEIAIAAWGVLDTFLGVDRGRITEFFESYAGSLGPKRVPC